MQLLDTKADGRRGEAMRLLKLPRKQTLVKIDRVCAWSLVGFLLVYFITGYGMTKGLISPELSKLFHNTLLPVPAAAAFAIHSAYGAHVALKRWKVWSPAWSAVLVVYVAAMIGGVIVSQLVLKTAGAGIQVPTRIEL